MIDSWNSFWTWFGRADNSFGVAAAGFAGYAAYRLRQQNWRYVELARQSPRGENFEQLLKLYE